MLSTQLHTVGVIMNLWWCPLVTLWIALLPSVVLSEVFRVLNYNTWGLRTHNEDHGVRFQAIQQMIRTSNFDAILLQEIWYRADHELLRQAYPYSTSFDALNPRCTSTSWKCSGLMILSKYPLQEVEFTPFSVSLFDSPLRSNPIEYL